MRDRVIIYILSPMIFLFGCSTIPNERLKDIDRRIVEISMATQTLEKEINDYRGQFHCL